MIATSRRLYAQDYPGFTVFNDVSSELEANGWNDRMSPEVLAVKVDIYLAMKVDLYLATKNWDLVADISRHLAENYPDQPQWWVHWADALKEMEKVEKARKVAIRGLKMHPEATVLHFNLACYDSLLGRFRSARKRLKRLIKQNSRFRALSVNDPDLVGLSDWIKTAKV